MNQKNKNILFKDTVKVSSSSSKPRVNKDIFKGRKRTTFRRKYIGWTS